MSYSDAYKEYIEGKWYNLFPFDDYKEYSFLDLLESHGCIVEEDC